MKAGNILANILQGIVKNLNHSLSCTKPKK